MIPPSVSNFTLIVPNLFVLARGGQVIMESTQSRNKRIRSLFIVHTSMLIFSVGGSIIVTGLWPYLQALDSTITVRQYGFAVASGAIGQMLFSPIFGVMVDKMNSVRVASFVCGTLFVVGNLMYANVSLVPRTVTNFKTPQPRLLAMIVARFVTGVGTANVAPNRYYVSKATFPSERTTHVAYLSLFQMIGFILGPAIQAALSPIGESGGIADESSYVFDMYTACGYCGALMGVVAVVIFLPFCFEEFSASALRGKETNLLSQKPERQRPTPRKLVKQYSMVSVIDGRFLAASDGRKSFWSSSKPDWLVTFACCFNFFTCILNFVLGETTATPLVMDQFSWTRQEAVLYLGITNTVGGIVGGLFFTLIGPLSKRFDERKLLVYCGLLPLIVGKLIAFPMTDQYPTMASTFTVGNVTYTRHGCKYDWCRTTPQLDIFQFYVSYAITICSYSFCIAITASLYSKALEKVPQGFWMGLLTTSGSLSRALGPMCIAVTYQSYGLYYTTGSVAIALTLALLVTLTAFRRLNCSQST